MLSEALDRKDDVAPVSGIRQRHQVAVDPLGDDKRCGRLRLLYDVVGQRHDLVLRELHNINTAPCANNGPMPTMGTILRTPCYSTFLRLVRSMECEIQASRLANIHRAFPQSVREAR